MDFKNWPDEENHKDFGCEEISVLVRHFDLFLNDNQLNGHQVTLEWELLKVKVYTKDWSSCLKSITWQEINRRYDLDLSNLLPLVDLVLTLPSTSADCERGFSAMKQIKTEHRASLLPSALDDLMMVYINSPTIEDFDPQLSINEWMKSKARRVSKEDNDNSKVESESSDESDCESICSSMSIAECDSISD